jgi:hypothetical protein
MPTVIAKSAITVATKTRIFMKVPHVLFKFTTADENGFVVPPSGGAGQSRYYKLRGFS